MRGGGVRRAIDNRPYEKDIAVGNGLIRSANQARYCGMHECIPYEVGRGAAGD